MKLLVQQLLFVINQLNHQVPLPIMMNIINVLPAKKQFKNQKAVLNVIANKLDYMI